MDSCYKELKSFSEIIPLYDSYIIEVEGTIWSGNNKLEEAFKTLDYLKKNGKQIYFLSNQTNTTREDIHEKLKNFGFEASIDNIYNCALLSSKYIKKHHPQVKRLYVIGEKGIIEEVRNEGFIVVSSQDQNNLKVSTEEEFQNMPTEEVDAVLSSFDMTYNYYKLAYASICLDKGALFFAANDESYVKVGSRNLPGTGAVTSSLEKVTNKEATVIGPPNGYGIKLITSSHAIDEKKCLLITDDIKAGVLFGKNSGLDTCLVMTGRTNQEVFAKEANKPDSILPQYLCKDLSI
jgi:Predicted sugar phosphatases of the HAD superfamily